MEKLLTGWDFRRILYLIGGIWMVAESVMDKMWIFIPFGFYFLAMAIFKFGCVAGNCEVPLLEKNKEKQE